MAIERFSRDSDYYFLSSMYPVKPGIKLEDGTLVPTVEHGYQAAKFENAEARTQVLQAYDGIEAKKVSERLKEEGIPIREDWEEVKVNIMKDVVARKFATGTRVAYLLLQTGDEQLIEGNTWDDTFWGVCPPGSTNGLNMLGRILMVTRADLRRQVAPKGTEVHTNTS